MDSPFTMLNVVSRGTSHVPPLLTPKRAFFAAQAVEAQVNSGDAPVAGGIVHGLREQAHCGQAAIGPLCEHGARFACLAKSPTGHPEADRQVGRTRLAL